MIKDVEMNDRRASMDASADQTIFDIDFPMDGMTDEDLAVYVGGSKLTLETDYEVDLTQRTITLTEGANDGDRVVIEGAARIVRDTAFPPGGDLRTGILNGDARRMFYILQEQQRDVGRVISLNKSEEDSASAEMPLMVSGMILGINQSGDGFTLYDLTNFPTEMAVVLDNPSSDDFLIYDGDQFVNRTVAEIKTLLNIVYETASDIPYNNSTSGLDADNAQDALDELKVGINDVQSSVDAVASPPTGGLIAWPVALVPSGWLECDGSAVSRTEYSSLYAVLGDVYGAGDGSSTFNLPDYRGEFLRGYDAGAGNDPDAASRTDRGDGTTGDAVGTKQDHQFESHTHTQKYHRGGSQSGGYAAGNSASTTETEASGGSETRPRNVSVKWIIKT